MLPHADHVAASLNFAGFLCGLALYGMLLALSLRRPAADRLPIATGVLGALWNLGAILIYGIADLGLGPAPPVLSAVAFTALGCLPAVTVHSVLRGWARDVRPWLGRGLIGSAYALSASAGLLHAVSATSGGAVPAALGLRLLTIGFALLVVPLVLATRRQEGWRRALWVVALAVFAVSALHLAEHEDFTRPWWVELLGHHASLPLAVAILSQDYPFALGDLLLKRALALGALVGLALAGLLLLTASPLATRYGLDLDNPAPMVGLLALMVGAALCYPWLRRLAEWFVDAVVLKRANRGAVIAEAGRLAQEHESSSALMEDVCRLLARALSAPAVHWREVSATGPTQDDDPKLDAALGAWEASSRTVLVQAAPDARSAVVVVPTSEPPRVVMVVDPLSGGRRLLSADTALLEGTAAVIGRRLDGIRLANERFERRYREQEISRLATEAELRALRAQINPHFLFNALTTIGYLIQTAPPRALKTLLRLTDLLRRVLRSEGDLATLGTEIDLVTAYLDIERARFEDRLNVVIDVPPALRDLPVPAFVLQPIVENAVRHGIAPSRAGGTVTITAQVAEPSVTDGPSGDGKALVVAVHDTGSAACSRRGRPKGEGIGLANVERRLALAYGPRAALVFEARPDEGTRVELRIPVDHAPSGAEAPVLTSGARP